MLAVPVKRKRRKPWKRATTLTREYYAKRGYRIAFVERVVKHRIPGTPWKKTRKFDAWGLFDFIAFKVGVRGMKGINSCKIQEINAHVEKFRLLSAADDWLRHDPGNRIVIMGWDRAKAPGQPVQMRCRQFRLEDLEPRDGDCCEWKARVKPVKRRKPGPQLVMEQVA